MRPDAGTEPDDAIGGSSRRRLHGRECVGCRGRRPERSVSDVDPNGGRYDSNASSHVERAGRPAGAARPHRAAVAPGARRAGGHRARLRRPAGPDARRDVRRRPRRRLVRGRLPPRDLPAGGGDAGRSQSVPAARLRPDGRPRTSSGRRIAAFVHAPLTLLPPSAADVGDGRRSVSSSSPLALWLVGRPRLARLRRRRALAAGRRRDARLAPDARPLRPRRPRLALPRRRLAPGLAVGVGGRAQVLRLAARRVARRDAQRSPRRSLAVGIAGSLAAPRAALHGPRRLRPRAAPARPRLRPGRATRCSGSSCRSAARVARTSRRRSLSARSCSPARWRYRSFTLAVAAALDALADRLARLLRRRRGSARDRPTPALVRSGSCRSRRGACSSAGDRHGGRRGDRAACSSCSRIVFAVIVARGARATERSRTGVGRRRRGGRVARRGRIA